MSAGETQMAAPFGLGEKAVFRRLCAREELEVLEAARELAGALGRFGALDGETAQAVAHNAALLACALVYPALEGRSPLDKFNLWELAELAELYDALVSGEWEYGEREEGCDE